MLAPEGEVFAAIGRGNPATARDPFIMSRIATDVAAWGTVAWWGSDDAPEVTLLRGSRDGVELAPAEASGIEVRVGERRLLLLTATGGADFGEIALEGSGALIEERDGHVARCLLADGASVDMR